MNTLVRALLLGDVVGDSGLSALETLLPALITETAADLVVANGENAADGFGLTAAAFERLLAAGVDLVTSGNHVWEKRDFWPILASDDRILRPANYPPGAPGRGSTTKVKKGLAWTVINLQGREAMTAIDCPFRWLDAFRASEASQPPQSPPRLILIDFHAESMQEKEALALDVDGWASALVGTHTHVATTDQRILAKGTAYISDLGMSGVQDAIIGMSTDICLKRLRTMVPYRMECAVGPGALSGVLIDFDAASGRALAIQRIARSL